MAVTHGLKLDPDEELWFPLDWTAVLSPATETINSHTYTPSAEATLDGHSSIASEHAGMITNLKATGGQLVKSYPWTVTINTTDSSSKTRKRQRTMIIQTIEK